MKNISHIITGRQIPSGTTIERIGDALGVAFSYRPGEGWIVYDALNQKHEK